MKSKDWWKADSQLLKPLDLVKQIAAVRVLETHQRKTYPGIQLCRIKADDIGMDLVQLAQHLSFVGRLLPARVTDAFDDSELPGTL